MEENTYRKNYRKLYFSVSLDNIANELSCSALITGYAIYLGLSEKLISLFLALRVLFCVVQIFSAPLFSRLKQSKKTVLAIYYFSRITFFLLISLCFIPNQIAKTALFLILISINSICAQITYAPFVNWRMQTLRDNDAKKFYWQKNTLVVIMATLIQFLLSYILDNYNSYYVYLLIFVCILTITSVDVILRITLDKPVVLEKEKISLKETLVTPLKDKAFSKIIVITTLYNFAYNLGTCFLSLYLISYVGLSYMYITVLTLINYAANILGGYVFSKIAVKHNNYKICGLCSFIALMILTLSLAIFKTTLIYLLPIIYLTFGFGRAGFSLFESNGIYEYASADNKTMYVSVCKFFVGLSSVVITLLSIFCINQQNNSLVYRMIFLAATIVAALTLILYLVLFGKRKDLENTEIKQITTEVKDAK